MVLLVVVMISLIITLMSTKFTFKWKVILVLLVDILLVLFLSLHILTYTMEPRLLQEAKERLRREVHEQMGYLDDDSGYEGIKGLVTLQHRYFWLEVTWALLVIFKVFS